MHELEYEGDLIERFVSEGGRKLKPVCEAAGVPYGTLHAQISRRSRVPFSFVAKIAREIGRPISDFSEQNGGPIEKDEAARQILQIINRIQAGPKENKSPTFEDFRSATIGGGFSVDGLRGIMDYCDIYMTLEADHAVAHPVEFGARSNSRNLLGLTGKAQYYKSMTSFDEGLKARALASHRRLLHERFFVDSEQVDEVIDGRKVKGTYLRAGARVDLSRKASRTFIFTQVLLDNTAR